MKNIKALCDHVRQTAYDIHLYHGHGHLEKVYENALAHRLRKAGLDVKQQYPLKVHDEDGTLIGDYLADLLGRRYVDCRVENRQNAGAGARRAGFGLPEIGSARAWDFDQLWIAQVRDPKIRMVGKREHETGLTTENAQDAKRFFYATFAFFAVKSPKGNESMRVL